MRVLVRGRSLRGIQAVGRKPALRDTDDFVSYVTNHAYQLKKIAFLYTGDPDEAEDLLQTALARLYLAWPRVARQGDPTGYARKVLLTTHISLRRRRWHREYPTAVLPDQADAFDGIGRSDDMAVLRAALRQLSPRQRAVVILRYYVDMSERDVARTLGCSAGTVKTLASRGLAKLNSIVGGQQAESRGTERST